VDFWRLECRIGEPLSIRIESVNTAAAGTQVKAQLVQPSRSGSRSLIRHDVGDGERPAGGQGLVQNAQQSPVGGLVEEVADVPSDRQVVSVAGKVNLKRSPGTKSNCRPRPASITA
jgi:hypothetical protein